VEAVVILNGTGNSWPLLKAVESALGERFLAEEHCDRPDPALVAAVGASMRALEWAGCLEGWKWKRDSREWEQEQIPWQG
jgi:hypothetical protein